MKSKQVIVMRKDLNMRKGKMVAQGAHASLGVVLRIQEYLKNGRLLKTETWEHWRSPFEDWIGGVFTKVCVGVGSEEELLEIFDKAQELGMPAYLITDMGQTEFHGVPTKTCLAIGPYWAEDVDKVTGKLSLL